MLRQKKDLKRTNFDNSKSVLMNLNEQKSLSFPITDAKIMLIWLIYYTVSLDDCKRSNINKPTLHNFPSFLSLLFWGNFHKCIPLKDSFVFLIDGIILIHFLIFENKKQTN